MDGPLPEWNACFLQPGNALQLIQTFCPLRLTAKFKRKNIKNNLQVQDLATTYINTKGKNWDQIKANDKEVPHTQGGLKGHPSQSGPWVELTSDTLTPTNWHVYQVSDISDKN